MRYQIYSMTISGQQHQMLYAIQSIVPKLDLIECEASSYDVLVFYESWLKPETPDESLHIENFSPPFRADRNDRPVGGVIVYFRDTLSSKRRPDLEVRGLEAVWVAIQIQSNKVLVGGFTDHQTVTQTTSTISMKVLIGHIIPIYKTLSS